MYFITGRMPHGVSVLCIDTGRSCTKLNGSRDADEVYSIQRDTGERVSNVVIMGSGEPLDNYDNVLRFLKLASDERALNISQRNLTMSTCGLVPQIYKMAEERLQITPGNFTSCR